MNGNVSFVRHVYKVQRELKTYTIFELETCIKETQQTTPILTDTIRVEVFRGFSYGKGFLHYLRLRNTENWSNCEKVTGLFQTDCELLFYGNKVQRNTKHLIMFFYSIDMQKLCIDYYPNFYPNNHDLTKIIERYIQLVEKIKGTPKRPPYNSNL